MADNGEAWDPSGFLAPVTGYYSDVDGNILSMPFNSSTPIMYYNKDVFEKAGLDRETPPKTWAELDAMGHKIMESGAAKCALASTWTTWIHTENLSAIHDQAFGTKENGFGGLDTEFTFNGDVQVKHWENLKKWADDEDDTEMYRYDNEELMRIKLPFRGVLQGASGSGKTNIAMNLISGIGIWDKVIILAKNLEEKLYRCYTDPKLLQQWFAPKPWTIKSTDVDIRPYVMGRSPRSHPS